MDVNEEFFFLGGGGSGWWGGGGVRVDVKRRNKVFVKIQKKKFWGGGVGIRWGGGGGGGGVGGVGGLGWM